MMPINIDDVTEITGEIRRPSAGGYICKILKVTDNTDKKYLTIDYDIADGEFKDYYTELSSKFGMQNWPAHYIRSYKESALGFFKHFLSTVDKCNGTTYINQCDKGIAEATFAGKYIGLVLGEEEYTSDKGEIKTRLRVARECTTNDIHNANFKIPEKKTESRTATGNEEFMQVPDGILPTEWN